MNFSSQNPKSLPVKVSLVKQIIVRLITRNEPDRLKSITDREAILKNFETFDTESQRHLMATLKMIDGFVTKGMEPTYEMGLVMGALITLSARSVGGILFLKDLLANITAQQDPGMEQAPVEETPNLNEVENRLNDEDHTTS